MRRILYFVYLNAALLAILNGLSYVVAGLIFNSFAIHPKFFMIPSTFFWFSPNPRPIVSMLIAITILAVIYQITDSNDAVAPVFWLSLIASFMFFIFAFKPSFETTILIASAKDLVCFIIMSTSNAIMGDQLPKPEKEAQRNEIDPTTFEKDMKSFVRHD